VGKIELKFKKEKREVPLFFLLFLYQERIEEKNKKERILTKEEKYLPEAYIREGGL
jgi:hypothetical protein